MCWLVILVSRRVTVLASSAKSRTKLFSRNVTGHTRNGRFTTGSSPAFTFISCEEDLSLWLHPWHLKPSTFFLLIEGGA
jgi:hypothetical protein